jgi:prophage regulatory protein
MIDRKLTPANPGCCADPVEPERGASPVDAPAAPAGSRTNPDEPRQMINEQQLLTLIPVSRTTLHRMMKSGTFPKGRAVSANRRLWLASEVAAWQTELGQLDPQRRRGKGRRRRVSTDAS